MENCFLHALTLRRSVYTLNNKIAISEDALLKNLKEAVNNVPSAFNVQSARIVVLLKDEHIKFWKTVSAELAAVIPPEKKQAAENKIKTAFASGYGTILYFEDEQALAAAKNKYPLYQNGFAVWAEQANGMLQYAVWSMLASAGIGASLQHYNPLIDKRVKLEWNLPDYWSLKAQMPFGGIKEQPAEKILLPIDERVKVFT